MIIWAYICLAISVIAAWFAYTRPKSTTTLIAKVILYFSLILFFGLMYASFFSSAPPVSNEPNLPV
ncbi:hypothetical protein Lsha_1050 [Legionella shakespearei DSM 23087]|uniref:Transmembrane protein n=1 Tax=Legionella shakespearei DSM 23087 TaxID=1122169 RepID=A0A0W0Z0B6_9GAMM|nr:hypothetical protein Lsha_1050 [Legionella shakespearei DSM 23087]